MAIINLLVYILFSIFLIGCKSNKYEVYSVYNNTKRTSTLFLKKDNIKIDSITNIYSYYGKDSLINVDEKSWDFYYKGRCGTGCSTKYYMKIFLVGEKLKVALNILSKYEEIYFPSQISTINEYLPVFSKSGDYIVINVASEQIKKTNTKIKLFFSKELNIFFNTDFKFKDIVYKGLKIDNFNYIYLGNNIWKFYNIKLDRVEDLN